MNVPFGVLEIVTLKHLQGSDIEIDAEPGNTIIMLTHDVNEADILPDINTILTNDSAASVVNIFDIDQISPQKRLEHANNILFYQYRAYVLKF